MLTLNPDRQTMKSFPITLVPELADPTAPRPEDRMPDSTQANSGKYGVNTRLIV